MKPSEALEIVAFLNAGFPREALEGPSIQVYADEIAHFPDPRIGSEAALLTVRQGERFPTVAEFRGTYKSLADAKRADIPALPEPPRHTVVPEWVHVWWWARRQLGDERVFPQQDEHGFAPGSMSLQAYDELAAEWRQAGAPMVGDLGEVMAGGGVSE